MWFSIPWGNCHVGSKVDDCWGGFDFGWDVDVPDDSSELEAVMVVVLCFVHSRMNS